MPPVNIEFYKPVVEGDNVPTFADVLTAVAGMGLAQRLRTAYNPAGIFGLVHGGHEFVGGIVLVSEVWAVKFVLLAASWGNPLLDRVIQASGMGSAFGGIAITLLIGLDTKPVVIRLKAVGYYKVVVRYFGECLFATFILLLCSILMEPLSGHASPVLLSASLVWSGTVGSCCHGSKLCCAGQSSHTSRRVGGGCTQAYGRFQSVAQDSMLALDTKTGQLCRTAGPPAQGPVPPLCSELK
jgi:hypothetical protein